MTTSEKNAMKAQNFILNAQEEFKKHFPRDRITDLCISKCSENGDDFDVSGSIGAVSPTGKNKTFGFTATVKVSEYGDCSLAKLEIKE